MSSSKPAEQAGHVEDVTAVPLRKLVATLLAISFGTILECECSFACARLDHARPAVMSRCRLTAIRVPVHLQGMTTL